MPRQCPKAVKTIDFPQSIGKCTLPLGSPCTLAAMACSTPRFRQRHRTVVWGSGGLALVCGIAGAELPDAWLFGVLRSDYQRLTVVSSCIPCTKRGCLRIPTKPAGDSDLKPVAVPT